MAEPDSGGSPKEMSMEVRLLLAFLLMGVVMFVTPYFYKTPPPAKNAQKTTAAQTEPSPAPAAPAAAETAAPIAPAAPAYRSNRAGHRGSFLAAGGDRYQPVPCDLQQPGRDGAELAAQEVQGQRQQAARPGESGRRVVGRAVSVFPLFRRSSSRPRKSIRSITPRRRMPTVWASRSGTATATPTCARRSASSATATCARCRAR